VLVKEVLANGRLTDRGDGDVVEVLKTVAGAHGSSVDQVAVAAALGRPFTDVVLSGAVTRSQLASNLGALELSLTEEDRDRLGSIAEDPAVYWDRRSALPWT
jgi:aryl-alcohol dehydrogenase-like predicted oxidoreductase